MMKMLQRGWAKKMMLLAFVLGLVSPSAMALNNEIAPYISNTMVSPQPYNPSAGNATVSFNLNTSARTTVDILDVSTGNILKNLMFDTTVSNVAGQASNCSWNNSFQVTCNWNGLMGGAGNPVPTGTYKAKVVAYNSISTAVSEYNFSVGTTQQVTAPDVTVSVSPTTVNKTQNQSATVTYTLNTPANLSVEVWQGNTLVTTLKTLGSTQPGTYSNLSWTPNANQAVGAYTVKVYATNTAGEDTATATVNVTQDTVSGVPAISNVFATPSPFDPDNQKTRIYFNLDKAASVTVKIYDGNSTVSTVMNNESKSGAGQYYAEWNGTYEGTSTIVPDGTYLATVYATNGAGNATAVTTTVIVDRNANNTGNACYSITQHYVTPSTFDPNKEDALIYFSNNQSANITVRIKDGSSTVKTLSSQYYSSGSRYVPWNGRNSSGSQVSNRTYTYEIQVDNCSNVYTGTIKVSSSTVQEEDYENDWPSTNEDLIKDLYVTNEVFDPTENERAKVTYTLTDRADVKVQVVDGNKVVKTLATVTKQTEGTYSYYWDGRDKNGYRVSDKVYQFRVMADNGEDTDTDRAYVEVDTDGVIIGFPTSARCAGFKDVSVNSPFCKAIELMSKKNIFDGYSDGTFRPYAKINRAEVTKVVTLALGYDIPDTGYFGKLFKDTVANAWYAKYLRVAKDNDIIHGYPDGYFRPERTINRVELLKIFLEGNRVDASDCERPFSDTPNVPSTAWFMKYACYAKEYGLMNSEFSNRLYPAEAMTRGDVADLFYDFEVKGLYNNANRYDYSYHYNNSTDNEDGYYVYQNGHYVWMPN